MSARPIDFGKSAAAEAPRRIGKYVVTEVLGEGAMGIVYKGIDPHIDRPVAIKTIRRQLLAPAAQDLEAVQRFRREARAAGRLSHPNIVSVYEYGEDGADMYIAMEYVEGASLLSLTGRGARLSLADTLSVVLQLLDALECAHEQNVWHRDIKPGNLLLTPDGRLKVTDFGIARIDSTHLTQMNTVMGSPGYMAPERYTGDEPDGRVDVFSCGVVLYELLAGIAPFRGSLSTVMYQVMHQTPRAPSTLPISDPPPASLDAVVARAMARRVEDRYDSAAAMRAELVAASPEPIRRMLSAQATARLRVAPPAVPSAPDDATQVLDRAAEGATPPDSAPTEVLPRGPAAHAESPAPQTPPLPARALPVTPAPTLPMPPQAATLPMPPPAPAPNAESLTRIERLLRPHLGPVTRYVLREAARQTTDLRQLVDTMATLHVPASERAIFLAQVNAQLPELSTRLSSFGPSALWPTAFGPSDFGTPSGPGGASGFGADTQPPALHGNTPLRPEVVEKAQRLLSIHIGPIAAVVVRRAAATSTSREQFFNQLADQAGGADRTELLAQLWRLA